MEQVPGTPLTLRAGLLSGRAYRHFVYKMTTESLQRWPSSYAVDQAGSSCLSERYWGYSLSPLRGWCLARLTVTAPIFIPLGAQYLEYKLTVFHFYVAHPTVRLIYTSCGLASSGWWLEKSSVAELPLNLTWNIYAFSGSFKAQRTRLSG
jgi:hypothetical protein